ncbi:MAG: DNA polymerase III subunit delta [Gammaproteobacteria bacterium]|nr:DNA polymerase III subunit delta [Gammaproteobacteria bacterium]
MQLRAAGLAGHLRGSLAHAYLVTGDDALLVEEACDAVLHAARKAGYTERSVLHVDANFNWNDVIQDAASMSLFAERRIIDVRVPAGKFDRDASEVLRRYADHPAADTLLLIRTIRLEGKQRKSAWFKALDDLGVVVSIWPVAEKDLPRWLSGRLRAAGLEFDDEALALLSDRVEGNLLAAVQEIEKLKLADLPSPVTAGALLEVLEDSARYGVFDLVDATFAGDARRVSRMVTTLRQEGVSLFPLLGALTSQLRAVNGDGFLPGPRKPLAAGLLERVGGRTAIDRVLAECALVDAQGKGQIPGDAWLSLEDLLLRLCGVRPLAVGSPLRLLRA